MDQNKLQHNYRDVSESRFDGFIRDFNATYEPRVVKPVTPESHVRVYHYGEGYNKFNICYDRLASSVQMTAGATMLDIIRMYLERNGCIGTGDPVSIPAKALSGNEEIVAVSVRKESSPAEQNCSMDGSRAKDIAVGALSGPDSRIASSAPVLTSSPARNSTGGEQARSASMGRLLDVKPITVSQADARGSKSGTASQKNAPQKGNAGVSAQTKVIASQAVAKTEKTGQNSVLPVAKAEKFGQNAAQASQKKKSSSAAAQPMFNREGSQTKSNTTPSGGSQIPSGGAQPKTNVQQPNSAIAAPAIQGTGAGTVNPEGARAISPLGKIFGKKSAKAAKKEKQKSSTPEGQKPEMAITQETEAVRDSERSYKDGYSLDKYERERFERGIKELEENGQAAKVTREESNPDTAQHTIKVSVLGKDKSKTTVQYAVRRKVMQIQGKPGALADLVQNIFSEDASDKAIIQARVEFNKAREKKSKDKTEDVPSAAPVPSKSPDKAAEKKVKLQVEDASLMPSALQKSLNKALPNGVKYLSKQSQTYLYYALVDLESNLSNYGGILATAYQGLENLISNLQRSEKIKVKLIGQAYEKENGKYTLKGTYRRKIKSVIYNEVMSALYTEYFDKRHFYTHSDNFSDTARIIKSQAEAKSEFARLVTVIEYNATKLSEIGFTVDNAAAFSAVKSK